MTLIKTEQLKNWDKNPREISDSQLESLKKFIKKWGVMGTLKVDAKTHEVLGGNMRLRAATELGISELPCELIDIEKVAKENDQTYFDAKLELALLDNNQFAIYIRQQLLDLLPKDTKIDLKAIQIDLNPLDLEQILSFDALPTTDSRSEDELNSFLGARNDETTFINIPVTAQQKGVILDRLEQIKDSNQVSSIGEALYILCNEDDE